jgi:hypothetical protein
MPSDLPPSPDAQSRQRLSRWDHTVSSTASPSRLPVSGSCVSASTASAMPSSAASTSTEGARSTGASAKAAAVMMAMRLTRALPACPAAAASRLPA